MSALEIARGYLARNWKPLPIPYKKKGPTYDDWQRIPIAAENLSQYFNSGPQNVGVQMGPASNGLTDVDLDCHEAITLAPHWLPPTNAMFGRRSKPKSHWLYTISDAPLDKSSFRLTGSERDCLIELRLGGGKGAQTVFPGSTHPSEEQIEWASAGAPAQSDLATLHAAVKTIACGVVLWRAWPPQGSRHNAALALGGFLARAGWEVDTIQNFVEIVAHYGGSDAPAARGQDAVDAAGSHARGENVYGLPGLIDFFGEKPAKRVAKILGYREAPAVLLPAAARGLPWRECMRGGVPGGNQCARR